MLEEVSKLTGPNARKAAASYKSFIEFNERFRRWSSELVDAQLADAKYLPDVDAVSTMSALPLLTPLMELTFAMRGSCAHVLAMCRSWPLLQLPH